MIIDHLKYLLTNLNYDNNMFANHSSIFIKEIAIKLEDAEMIGIATILENKSDELLEQEFGDSIHDDFYEKDGDCSYLIEDKKDTDYRKAVRNLCIQMFYKDKEFSINMDKYKELVEDNKEILEKNNAYKSLSKYTSESAALDKIYNKIKNDLQSKIIKQKDILPPTTDVIRELFPLEVQEIYRLADKYVQPKIEEIKRLEERSK